MSDKSVFDVAVVGGGHNGLVCACYLAKAGLKTIVLERTSAPPGAFAATMVCKGWGSASKATSPPADSRPQTGQTIRPAGVSL